MSYLALPRLSFFGTAYTNPSTANNNDMASVFDVDTVRLNPKMELYPTAQAVYPPAPDGNSFNWSGADDNPDLRNWLMGLMEIKGFHEDEGKDGIGHGQMGHWNYYGDHNTEFQQTQVNGAVLLSGQQTPATDPALQLQVEILGDVFYGRRRGGVLVDVDPYALVTSQIFTGQFRLTYNPKPNVSIPVLIADHPTPAYSYFISPYKNLGPQCEGFEAVSSVFQFALKKENLSFIDNPEFNSPAIQQLKRLAMSEQGLMVRYCFYDALYETQAVELNAKFRKRQFDSNPYVGKVLGSIGVWKKGELATAPVGRKLRTQIPFEYVPPQPHLTEEEHQAKRRSLHTTAKYRPRKAAAVPSKLPTAVLGATLAEVDTARQVVTLDCASTFPEADPQTRKKFDLGPMQLVLHYGADGSQSVTIGDIPYDQATYERGGGVVEVSYASSADKATIGANLATGQLVIYRDMTKTSQLLESSGLDVLTDNRSLYFDLQVKPTGKDPVDGAATIRLKVRRKGAPITEPAKLNLEYWMCVKDVVNPDKAQVPVPPDSPYYRVDCDGGVTALAPTQYTLGYLNNPTYPSFPGGVVLVKTDQVTVPAGGELTLTLTALRSGVSMVRYVDPTLPAPVAPNFGWDNVDYTTVRILPFDDYSQYSDSQINDWNFIYSEVFGYYSVIHPIMSKVIPWGPRGAPNNAADVREFAATLLAFTDPAIWYSTIYMPITRDLSGGKRELLRRWCNLQQ